MRALLIGLREAATVVARVLLARGHVVDARSANDRIAAGWLDEPYDLVIDRWPGPGRLGFTSWGASACGDPFTLTIVDGDPGFDIIEALLGAGTDDVIAGSALERLLGERVLVIEHHVFRRAARKKSEAITLRDLSEEQAAARELAENHSTTRGGTGDGVIARDADGAVTRTDPVAEKPAPAEKSVVRSVDVLIVDDDIGLGKAFLRVLRGHQVTVVTRAKDALDLLESGQEFDVIFSDLMMPEMSGMEFHAEALRRFPEAADRMVFVTGGTFTTAAISFLERIPNPRLEKPFEPDAVRALVRELTERRAAPMESGTMELRRNDEGAAPVVQKGRPRPEAATRRK